MNPSLQRILQTKILIVGLWHYLMAFVNLMLMQFWQTKKISNFSFLFFSLFLIFIVQYHSRDTVILDLSADYRFDTTWQYGLTER